MNKTSIFLIAITLIGLFFYSFRLKETQLFRDDTARDTLKILKIWQNKELTLIGPPVSFTLASTKEVYLGSLFLYIGLFGLIFANWDAVGAVLPNVFFFTLSIPVFYRVVSRSTDSFWIMSAATVLYTLSPITVTHARFFWNPNLIIPFAVFFWYFVLKKTQDKKVKVISFFLAGIIAGLVFNFHYLAAIPLVIYIFTLFFSRQFLPGLSILAGLIGGALPIIVFELRNNFYLTQVLFLNSVQGHGPDNVNLIAGVNYFFNIFWSILGLRQSEIGFPAAFMSPFFTDPLLYVVTLTVLVAVIVRRPNSSQSSGWFWPILMAGILLAIYFSSGNTIRLRYLFSIYPILIWLMVSLLSRVGIMLASAILFIPIVSTSIAIITHQPSLEKDFISLPLIEKICREIVKDNPSGNYNITENLKGDARAMSFRYCLNRDAKIKPNDELSYNSLTSLYVISPSLDKIYQDNRWEFYASGPWKLLKTLDFGEVSLYKFIKDEKA